MNIEDWNLHHQSLYFFWNKLIKGFDKINEEVSSKLPLDIIIPAIEKDIAVLPQVVESIRQNLKHPIGEIMIVSPNSPSIVEMCREKKCRFILENLVTPIPKEAIKYSVNGLDRSGWLLQQFLKLNADSITNKSNFLVVDADTVMISPQIFEYQGKMILNISDEFHRPYYKIFERLLGYSIKVPLSFVSHHMLFNRENLDCLKREIEKRHGIPWYQAIINNLDKKELSGFSEYELYGHYMYLNFKENITLAYWRNLCLSSKKIKIINIVKEKYRCRYKTISFHSYQ